MADPHKDESGHGRRAHKEEYRDGHCKVERKWEGNGDYKEERKCEGAHHLPVRHEPQPERVPGIVISLPEIVILPATR